MKPNAAFNQLPRKHLPDRNDSPTTVPMPHSRLSVFIVAVSVILAGCSGFGQPGGDGTSPPTSPSSATPNDTGTLCVTIFPVPELLIGTFGYITPTEKRVTILIRELQNESNQSHILFNRQYVVPTDRKIEVMDIPGWNPDHEDQPEGRFTITVRVHDGSSVTKGLGNMEGNIILVKIEPGDIEVEAAYILPITATC